MEATPEKYTSYEFSEPQTWAEAVADRVEAQVQAAVEERGVASVILPGGSTPRAFFEVLRERPLPWSKLFVTLSDERWVNETDPQSNAGQLRRLLLRGPAAEATFLPLRREGVGLEACERDIQERMQAMPRPFDLTLLGMGNDGHTASLFPGAEGLEAALDRTRESVSRVLGIARGPEDSVFRISLSLRSLLDTRGVLFLLRGDEKKATFEEAMKAGSVRAMPVRAVLREAPVPIERYWCP